MKLSKWCLRETLQIHTLYLKTLRSHPTHFFKLNYFEALYGNDEKQLYKMNIGSSQVTL